MTDIKIKPFFINSNLCTDKEDIISLDKYLDAIVYNIGNSYPTWSLIKQLQGGFVKPHHIKNIWNYDFSKQDKDIDIINNECTHVFLILQDQIRIVGCYNQVLPYDNIINFIKKIKKPLTVVSLGANSYKNYNSQTGLFEEKSSFKPDFHTKLTPELVNFLHELSANTEMIGIRGYLTQEILSKLGINNTQVIGCPSYYEMGRNRIIKKKPFSDNLKVILANPANPFNNYTIIPISKIRNYPAVVQDEYKYLKIIVEGELGHCEYATEEIENLKQHKYNCFSDIKSWKEYISNFDFLYGIRIHGSIIALNSGIPSMVMSPDIKGQEMTEFMKIPNHPELLNCTDIQKIYEACDYDEMNKCYPKLYDDYVDFLHKNGLILFEENPSQKYDYAEQPKLELYSAGFCTKLSIQIIIRKIKIFIQKLFSVKNENNHKALSILAIKMKFRRT